MRHTAVLEFTREITVDEKLVFFNQMKTDKSLSYTDVSSANNNAQITIYFSTEDGDKGRAIFEDKKIQISTLLSFERLVELHAFTELYHTNDVVDLVAKYGTQPVEPEEPSVPPITA